RRRPCSTLSPYPPLFRSDAVMPPAAPGVRTALLLELLDHLLEHLACLVRALRNHRQPLQSHGVLLDVSALLLEETARQLLHVDHVGQVVLRVAQDRERPG